MAEKFFRIRVENDDGDVVVLDEMGRELVGVDSIVGHRNSILITMKFALPTRDPLRFTIRPFFEEKSQGLVRDVDGAVFLDVGDIIMNEDCGFTFTLRHRKEFKCER